MVGAIALFLFITLGETFHYSEILLSRDFAPLAFLLGLVGVEVSGSSVLYLLSTVLTMGIIMAVGGTLVLTISRSFLSAKNRLVPLPVERLAADYGITRREQEILQLVARGLSNKEIGAELLISEGTVKAHLHRIMGKLNAGNRTELVVRMHAAAGGAWRLSGVRASGACRCLIVAVSP
jgi:DNA-binding CsgD family transcriptional regulator